MDYINIAKEFEKQGKKAQAAEAYLKCASETDEIWTAAKAGELFYEVGQIEKAKNAYHKIIGCGNYSLYDHLIDFYIRLSEYEKASELFICCYPCAPYSKKLAYADKLLSLKAYGEAEIWYLNCIDNVYQDRNPYLTKAGEFLEKFSFLNSRAIAKADEYFYRSEYKSALMLYSRHKKNSRYAKVKSAECAFMLKEYDKAKEYYRDLAQETDDAYFMFMLAECYNSEDIDTNTLENAVYWYEYALSKGCKLCYYHLGMCYQFGRGTEENAEKAEEMYVFGSKNEEDKANCLCKLGNIAIKKGDSQKAAEYYSEAAKLGNQRALLNIAIAYFENEIPYFSYEQIKCFLAKSAALGSKRAYDMFLTVKHFNEKSISGEALGDK